MCPSMDPAWKDRSLFEKSVLVVLGFIFVAMILGVDVFILWSYTGGLFSYIIAPILMTVCILGPQIVGLIYYVIKRLLQSDCCKRSDGYISCCIAPHEQEAYRGSIVV